MANPTASIFYGYNLGEFENAPDWWLQAEDGDGWGAWEEEAARRKGWVEAPYPLGDDREYDYSLSHQERAEIRRQNESTPEYKEWEKSNVRRRQIINELGVQIIRNGDDYEPEWGISVVASEQHVTDWGVVELKPVVTEFSWDRKLNEFVKLMEIEIRAPYPKWYLECNYA
jgi:hypothetical protein